MLERNGKTNVNHSGSRVRFDPILSCQHRDRSVTGFLEMTVMLLTGSSTRIDSISTWEEGKREGRSSTGEWRVGAWEVGFPWQYGK